MAEADIASPEILGKIVSPHIYVYIIAAAVDAIKVGVAKNVQRRLKALQTGQHRKLSIFYELSCSRAEAYAVECRAHRLLKERLLEGEWFQVSPEEGKLAIEKAMAYMHEERRIKDERTKNVHPPYEPPTIVEVSGRKADEFSALDIAQRVAPEKKEVVVLFDDRAIFVGRGAIDKKKGEPIYMINDVTRWYMPEEGAAA
jgi:hypothetical protein